MDTRHLKKLKLVYNNIKVYCLGLLGNISGHFLGDAFQLTSVLPEYFYGYLQSENSNMKNLGIGSFKRNMVHNFTRFHKFETVSAF